MKTNLRDIEKIKLDVYFTATVFLLGTQKIKDDMFKQGYTDKHIEDSLRASLMAVEECMSLEHKKEFEKQLPKHIDKSIDNYMEESFDIYRN